LRLSASLRAACLSLALVLLGGGLAAGQVQPGVTSIQALPAVTDSDDRFGIGNVYPDQHWLTLAQNAGMHWNRWEFRWSTIEPRAGQFDWDGSDRVVDASRAARLNVQGILISTPRWAETRSANSAIPSGLYEPWDSPANTWGQFVRAIAERYRGRVQAWEVWNEPDYPRGSFSFWFGSKADYYQLLKVAYRAIRSVDPSAPVLIGGLMYWAEPGYLEDLLSMALHDPEGPANNYFFDAVAWHVYSRPTDVYERVRRSRLLLQNYAGQKAIWVNEGNLPVWSESRLNDYGRFPLSGTLEEQAAWVVQWYAYALAAGADRALMYRMHDSDEPEAWGLARSDGSLRPAYVAYQLAARYFSHSTAATRATLGDAEQIIFERPGQRVLVVWNRTPRPVTAAIGAAAPSALLVALDGTTQPITPTGGRYVLALPPATANTGVGPDDYLVGGPPYIIVEDIPASLRRTEEADPALSWAGRWGDEPQAGASSGTARASADAGAAVSFAFSGTSVTWYTSLGPRGGVAQLSLDGAPLDEIDLYNSSAVPQAPLTYLDLGDGPHVLTVTVTGAQNPRAIGSYVTIDAFLADRALKAPPLPIVIAATPTAAVVPVTALPLRPTRTPTPVPASYDRTRPSWLPTPLGMPTATPLPTSTPVVIATAVPSAVPTALAPSPTAPPTMPPTVSPTAPLMRSPTPPPSPSPTTVPTALPSALSPATVPTAVPIALPTAVLPSTRPGAGGPLP
jgi:O-glycosyl hydrolase